MDVIISFESRGLIFILVIHLVTRELEAEPSIVNTEAHSHFLGGTILDIDAATEARLIFRLQHFFPIETEFTVAPLGDTHTHVRNHRELTYLTLHLLCIDFYDSSQ